MGYLFGFSGRFGRGDWWMAQLVILAILAMTIAWLVGDLSLASIDRNVLAARVQQHGLMAIGPLLACAWISIAAAVKRYHDRDKSGWWVLISIVPYVGQLWQFVECGFLAGTPGGNGYGEPHGGRAAATVETDELLAARMRFGDPSSSGFTTAATTDGGEPLFLGRPRADVAPVLFGRRDR